MENTQNLPDYIVYTDGGCAINPGGHGAYAAIIIHTDTGEIEEYCFCSYCMHCLCCNSYMQDCQY